MDCFKKTKKEREGEGRERNIDTKGKKAMNKYLSKINLKCKLIK